MPLSKIVQDSVNGGVAGTGPAFAAYQSTQQSLTANTWTKIQLQSEEFDTNNTFDSTTNYRFTPTVAGYYQINGGIYVAAGNTTLIPMLYKNGNQWKQGTYLVSTASVSVTVSSVVYMNGTTDYIELYGQSNVTCNTGPYQQTTYLNGFLARAA